MVEAGDVNVLVERDLVEILEGANVDYREDETGIGFVIDVPNAPAFG